MSTYKFKTKPYAHQRRALRQLLGQKYGGALLCEPRTGKGLRHGTPVITADGVVPIEEITEGDRVMGRDGTPTRVTGVYPRGELDVYRVTFNDGTSVTVDEDHLWATRTHTEERRGKDYRVVSTRELIDDERLVKRRYEIPQAEPVQWPERDLPIDPYVLGVLLGDGNLYKTAHFCTDEETMAEVGRRAKLGKVTRVDDKGHSYATVKGAKDALESWGLIGSRAENKFIPEEYLYASVTQRIDLLRGLMDTDGGMHDRGKQLHISFGSTSQVLRDQVAFLIESIGGQARKTIKKEPRYQGGIGQPYYRLSINLPINPFLTRPGWRPRKKFQPKRIIKSIEYEGTAEVTCIKVDAEDQLFLTDHFIVTHNTKTTIDWLSILARKGHVDRVVIVCPARVMSTWLQEFHTHCPLLFNITVWDSEARKQPPPPVSSTYDLSVVIVNYEAFSTPGRKTKSGRESKTSGRYKVRNQLRTWLGDGSTAAGVLDESHKIKNPSGKAAKMLVTMGPDFSRRVILTGTVITKAHRAHDVFMQWKFLNPARFAYLNTIADFKNHFGRWAQIEANGRAFPKFLGPRNMDELRERMAHDAVIVRREDCFDLPPREDVVEWVDLKSSRGVYEQMASSMIAHLESGSVAEASIELVRMLRMSQLTSGFVTNEQGEVERVGVEKLKALQNRLEPLLEAGEKVVVAARWRADLDIIESTAREYGVPVWSIRGGKTRADTDEAIREFRRCEDAAVIVIQPSSAALGIDLSTASHMIWYSHTHSWVDFSQACDRIALSRNSTTFIHLVARHSIDETLMETLANDGDIAKQVMTQPKKALLGSNLKVDSDNRLDVKKGG